MKTMVNIALPKGRLGEKVYALLKNAGFSCPELEESSRKLVFENEEKGVRYFKLISPSGERTTRMSCGLGRRSPQPVQRRSGILFRDCCSMRSSLSFSARICYQLLISIL